LAPLENRDPFAIDMTMGQLTSKYLVANKNKYKVNLKVEKKIFKPSTPSPEVRLFSRMVSSKGFNERFK